MALSGGLDSVVLLDAVCAARQLDDTLEVWAFHIHHGLQTAADQWLAFCEKLAKKYQVHFDFRLLHFANTAEGNIEARARAGRYDALTELCHEHGIENLLLAHHQNDQAETVLLQLLRGAGVAGLSAMPEKRLLSAGDQAVTLWRPLLNLNRAELEAYAKAKRLKWIEDPSNLNPRFRRNAIRNQILPSLAKIQPEAIANLARSANLLAESQKLLDRLASQDAKGILKQTHLHLAPLLTLAQVDLPAANNVLRYWLKLNHLAMPSQERLTSWWQDLHQVSADAHLEWSHDGASIRLWRGMLQLVNPESGRWIFQPIPRNSKTAGISAKQIEEALNQGLITQRERQGAEKLQIKAKTPRKTLKNLFQEADIPPWQRHAPLLYLGDEIIAVAGVGVSHPHLTDKGVRVLPQWIENQWSAENPVK
ncbi:tRNA(Ile)-lysidine synthase [Polynucleobacter meluiroseus]|uniref:tRNA(Ile)-lysidine synthase n=1 Tax=Polynucleobacter meluiroseus TaxID=1938814 RepID=A0A240DZQ2_9BURK|nr:tRNA(Ile)-lysidine synthase [Polynucleobacter meluiroseus]